MDSRFQIFPVITAVIALNVSGCDRAKFDEKAALDTFKKDTEELGAWLKEKRNERVNGMKEKIASLSAIVSKLNAVKVEGLPEDLKGAWTDFVLKVSKLEDLFTDVDRARSNHDGSYHPIYDDFNKWLGVITSDAENASSWLTIVARKYGLNKIDELSPR